MRNGYLVYISLLFILLLTQSVYAQQEFIVGWGTISKFIAYITGLPQGMFDTLPEFLFHFVVPLLLIWFICLGFMKQLRLFTRAPEWIEWFISFSMAALAIYPTGWFAWIVVKMAALSGMWATIAFFAMFCVGIFFYFVRWGSPQMGIHHFLGALRKEDDQIRRDLDDLRKKYTTTPGLSMTDSEYLKKRKLMIDRLDKIQEKRRALLKED